MNNSFDFFATLLVGILGSIIATLLLKWKSEYNKKILSFIAYFLFLFPFLFVFFLYVNNLVTFVDFNGVDKIYYLTIAGSIFVASQILSFILLRGGVQVVRDKNHQQILKTWLKYKDKATEIYLLGKLPKEVEKDLEQFKNKPCSVKIFQSIDTAMNGAEQTVSLIKLSENKIINFSLFDGGSISKLLFIMIAKIGDKEEYEAIIRVSSYNDRLMQFVLTGNKAKEFSKAIIVDAPKNNLLIWVDSQDTYNSIKNYKKEFNLKLEDEDLIHGSHLRGDSEICEEMKRLLHEIKQGGTLDVTYVVGKDEEALEMHLKKAFKEWIVDNYNHANRITIRRIFIAPKDTFPLLQDFMSEMASHNIEVSLYERELIKDQKLEWDFSLYSDESHREKSFGEESLVFIKGGGGWRTSESESKLPCAISTTYGHTTKKYRTFFDLLHAGSIPFSKIPNE